MISRFLDSLEVRIGRYRGIRNLMTILCIAMGAVYLVDYLFAPMLGFYLSGYLAFDRAAILRGEVWRVFTFIITPPSSSLIFILMELLFINFTGNMLQSHWGTLRFNIFYFTGMLGSLIAGFITGYATSHYVNLSLFLAVAILYPMMQINIYGIIPMRMKWLALIDVLLILPGLINGTWGMRAAIVVSFLNIILFFADRFIRNFKEAKRRYEWKKNWRTGNWR